MTSDIMNPYAELFRS